MRIALTSAYCWPEVRRGGERYLHELAGALARRGHQITVLSSAWDAGTSTEDGTTVVRLQRRSADEETHERRFATMCSRRLLLGRFDVVHALGVRDAVAAVATARWRGHRTVYTNLGNPLKSWWDEQPDRALHERLVRDVDVYGCLSAHAANVLADGYGRRGALTRGGVSTSVFTPAATRASRPTLLYSGVLTVSRKHVALLLEAVALLAARMPDVELWLSGSGDPSELLAKAPPAARERTTVLPIGSPADQPARYGQAWATVLPSVHEAFGLALVESLACGTPIVGADDAALPELVRPGVGALATPGDAASLATACEAALGLASEPGITDRCRAAAEPYDWDRSVAPEIEALYRD